jgi:hypothetical protein
MKIDPNLTIGSVGPKSPVRPQGRKGAFEEVLSGIEQKVIRASTLLHAIPPSQITPQRIKALGMSEQAIDALEGYARMLADPNTSLKTLQTNVDELSAVRAELHEASGALSDDDPLKGLIRDMASTIDSEVLRFERGDLLG